MKLNVFSDRAYLPNGGKHVTLLYPFWGKNAEDPGDPFTGRYDRYVASGKDTFEMTALENAELAVLPGDWGHFVADGESMERAQDFFALACRAGIPTALFFWNDSDEPIDVSGTVVFRTSFYRTTRRANEFAMPSWSEDFLECHLEGRLPLRKKQGKPTVGFCGYAPGSVAPSDNPFTAMVRVARSRIKRLVSSMETKQRDGAVRGVAMQVLKRHPSIETNFVVREHFLGGALRSGSVDIKTMQTVRRDYVRNMVSSDYVLCARGAGNFSYRLYETLSCGRIPVFIDTDCVLPYQSEINWKDFCVWVDASEVGQVGDRIAAFHEALSERQFGDLQRECRRVWERYLSPEGFFANFRQHFR